MIKITIEVNLKFITNKEVTTITKKTLEIHTWRKESNPTVALKILLVIVFMKKLLLLYKKYSYGWSNNFLKHIIDISLPITADNLYIKYKFITLAIPDIKTAIIKAREK